MPYIIRYGAFNFTDPRYVFSTSVGSFAGTSDRLRAKEYRTHAGASGAAGLLRTLGFRDVQIEERTTLAQETAGARQKPEGAPAPDDDSPLNQHVRKRIAELMEGKGWTAKDVPGLRQRYVLDALAGRKKMSRDMIERWADAFGLDVLTFLEVKEPSK